MMAPPETAWALVIAALGLIFVDILSLIRNPKGCKRHLRAFGILVGGWMVVIFALLAMDVAGAVELTSSMRRIATFLVISLLIAETIADCADKVKT